VAKFVHPETGERFDNVPDAEVERATKEFGLVPLEQYERQQAETSKPFVQRAGEAIEAAGNVPLRALEAAADLLPRGGMADANRRLAGETWSPSDERARELAEEHPIASAAGQLISETPVALIGGIPGAALRIGQTAIQGSAEESFVEGTGYTPQVRDALFFGGLQLVFEAASPTARALRLSMEASTKRIADIRARTRAQMAIEESVERGKSKLDDVFSDPNPLTRADSLAENADDVAAMLGAQAELNAKYLTRETRKFLDNYFGKSGKVSAEAADYARDLKREWADEVQLIATDDPSPVVRAWADEQLAAVRSLPDDPRSVHRAMVEAQLDSPLGKVGAEDVEEALDASIRDLLSGTTEGAELLQRYDDLAAKGLTGRAMQTLREFSDVASDRAGAVKEWLEQPQNREALRDAIDAIDGASGLASAVPGATKTLRAATGAARTLLDHYDELTEAIAGKGIREAATAGAKAVAKSRADRVLAKYGPQIGAGLGGMVMGLPGAAIGGAAGAVVARAAERGPVAAKALDYARRAARTRMGYLVTDEAAMTAADVVAAQAGRIAGTVAGKVVGDTIGAASGIPGLGFVGGAVGGAVLHGTSYLGSRYLEEPLKKLARFATREREQTARQLVTPGSARRSFRDMWNDEVDRYGEHLEKVALGEIETRSPFRGLAANAALRVFYSGGDDHRSAWAASRDVVLQSDDELLKSLGDQFSDIADEYPDLFEQIVQQAMTTRDFLQSKLPAASASSLMNPDGIPPDRHTVRRWALYYTTALAPTTALEDLRNGRGRLEQVETLRALYPQLYTELRNDVVMEIAKGARPTVAQRARLNLLFELGPELDPLFSPSLAMMVERAAAARAQQQGGGGTPAARVPGAGSGKGPAERYASPMRTQAEA
jgi:hypothetical protein